MRTKKRRAAPDDLLDPAGDSSPEAEKACLAYLLNLVDLDQAAGGEILADLSVDMWTIDCGQEVFRAIAAAYAEAARSVGRVAILLRKQCDELGIDHTEPLHLLTDLAHHASNSIDATLSYAKEAAVEVREMFTRRTTRIVVADLLARLHDRSLTPEDVRDLATRVGGVADLMEKRQTRGRRLRVRKASDIEAKPIEWFWPKRISSGSLTIITGMPGLSKSLLTIDIAARITTGGRWPDDTGSAPHGGVMLFGTEDDPEKVVIPRLIAAGADRELVRIVDGAEDGQSDFLSPVTIERDLALVREQLEDFPECRAIVFDPLSQFIDADENSNADTRAALAPLVDLAQERNLAILAVMHLNKKTDSMMIQRIAGAGSYGQVARHILFVGNDPDDPATGFEKRRAMIVAKNSYGPINCGQMYRVITRAGDQPGIEWIAGSVDMDAERLNPKPPGVSREQQERRGEAVDALRELLEAGELPAGDVKASMEGQGFNRRQIDHAAATLGVKKSAVPGADGRRKAWVWSLEAADQGKGETGTWDLESWPDSLATF